MLATLEKLIQPILAFKFRHPTSPSITHSHTVALVTQDEAGQYWLEVRCQRHDCPGLVRRKLLTAQVKEWEKS